MLLCVCMHTCMYVYIHGWMDAWMDRCLYVIIPAIAWVEGGMDGWTATPVTFMS